MSTYALLFLGWVCAPRNISRNQNYTEIMKSTDAPITSSLQRWRNSSNHIFWYGPTIVSPCCSCPCIFSEMTSLSTHHLGYRYLKYQSNSFSHPWMHKLTKLRSRLIWSFQCLPELRQGSIMTKDSIHQPHIHESKISSQNKRNFFDLLISAKYFNRPYKWICHNHSINDQDWQEPSAT